MTLENLNTILKNLAAEHLQLNDYYFGSLSQAMSKSNVIAYPCLIATVENVRVQKMLSSFTLKLFFIDKLLPGGENIDDVIADMEAVANDYYLLLTNKDWVKDYIMIDAFNGSIIADRLPDDVAGWVITLDCRSYSALCLDDLPITGTVPTYERCVVEGEQGNIVIIGDNNRITDGQLNITDIANKGDIPTMLSELQEDSQHRTVTDSEKAVWNKIGKYKGVFTSYSSLVSGVPNPEAGDWAHVDEGIGSDIELYIYDGTDNEWKKTEGSSGPETDPIFTAWLNTNPLDNFLTEVSTDNTIDGNGTTNDPLKVANYLVNDKTTATFDGCYTVIPINTKAETLIMQGYEVIKWKIYGYNQSGSNCTVSVDILKNSVSMVGSGTMPNLTNAKIEYGVPTGWTTTQLSENDLLTFNVSSNSDATYVNIVLLLKKTS